MKISIITVCKNMGRELEKTIESIKSQKFKEVEYVIVDGDSSDDTKSVIKKYKKVIDKFVSEKDGGIFEAMNKGLQMAKGDYIYFLNAGDTFVNDNVLTKVERILSNSKADILYGNVKLWQGNESWINKFSNINRWFLIKNSICHQAVFTKRGVFEKWGVFDESYQIAGDYDWFVNCWLDSQVRKLYVDLTIANFSLNGKSSSQKYRHRVLEECEVVRNKYFGVVEIWFYKTYKLLGKIKSWQ